MARGENAPPPADWSPTPKPWSERRCCPTCESAQHAIWIHGESAWMNERTTIASAELDPRGSE